MFNVNQIGFLKQNSNIFINDHLKLSMIVLYVPQRYSKFLVLKIMTKTSLIVVAKCGNFSKLSLISAERVISDNTLPVSVPYREGWGLL